MPVIFVTVEYKLSHIFAVIEDHINRSLVFSVSGKSFACELFWHRCTYISIKYTTSQVFPRWVPRKERILVHGLYRFYLKFVTTCLHAVAVKIFLYCLRLFSASKQILNGLFETGLQRYHFRGLVHTNCSKNLLSTLSSVKVVCDNLTCSNFRNV